MAIPDHVYDDCAQLTYTNGDWTAHYKDQPFQLHIGLLVLAYDDRCDDWVNGVVTKFERDKILVQYEDGYRFLFTSTRAAIRPKSGSQQPAPPPQAEVPMMPTVAPMQDAGSASDIWRALLQNHGEAMYEQGRLASRVESLEDQVAELLKKRES